MVLKDWSLSRALKRGRPKVPLVSVSTSVRPAITAHPLCKWSHLHLFLPFHFIFSTVTHQYASHQTFSSHMSWHIMGFEKYLFGCMDDRMDGWMDGWINGKIISVPLLILCSLPERLVSIVLPLQSNCEWSFPIHPLSPVSESCFNKCPHKCML